MPDPFILGINGSPHGDGIVASLLDAVLSAARDHGARTRRVDLAALRIVHETGAYSTDPALAVPERMPPDDIVALYPDILRADGLVLATPVYWANMSGIMKDFIDHLTPLENDGFRLQGKVAGFIAASKENEGGVEMAAMAMVAALAQMGVLIPPNAVLWHPGQWVTAGATEASWAAADAPKLGRNMVDLIRLLRERPINWSA